MVKSSQSGSKDLRSNKIKTQRRGCYHQGPRRCVAIQECAVDKHKFPGPWKPVSRLLVNTIAVNEGIIIRQYVKNKD
jgi:hypothetical protein